MSTPPAALARQPSLSTRGYKYLFLAIDSVLHFTLDLFASECERVTGESGPVPFASFFKSDHAVGDGRTVPLDPSGTTWVFPPVPLMRMAIAKCKRSPARSALVLPLWAQSDTKLLPIAPDSITRDDVYGSSSTRLRLPPGSASRRCSSLHEGAVREELSRHALLLVLFNITVADATKVADLIGAQPPTL